MKKILINFLPPIVFFILILVVLFVKIFQPDLQQPPFIALSVMFFVFFIASFSYSVYKIYKYITSNNVFYYEKYDSINNSNNLGVVILSSTYEVLSSSEYANNVFGENIVGRDIFSLFPQYKEIKSFPSEFKIQKENNHFLINFNLGENWFSIRDITLLESVVNNNEKKALVIGEIEIDNLNSLNFQLDDQNSSKLKILTTQFLDEISKEYHFLYREFDSGKFLITMYYETFEQWQKNHFSVFRNEKLKLKNNQNLWLSIGFGFGSSNLDEIQRLANEALSFSKIRGGNQISIYEFGKKPFSYGSYGNGTGDTSLVSLKNVGRLLVNKLRDTENILLFGHINSDLDSFGAAYGLGYFLKQYAKKVFKKNINFFIQNKTFDSTTKRFLKINEPFWKQIFISEEQSSLILNDKSKRNSTLSILVDTSDFSRIENSFLLDMSKTQNLFIFDHHGITLNNKNQIDSANVYIDTNASSTCEIITNLILLNINSQIQIEREVAQILLNGVYVDSAQFKKQTTSATFNSISALVRWGAKPLQTAEFLKISEEESSIIKEILSTVKPIKAGYFLAAIDKEVSLDLISIACEQILAIKGREAAFVVAKVPEKENYKMSARSLENINVQFISEQVGGGGNPTSAAAFSTTETFDEFVENIKLAILRVNKE